MTTTTATTTGRGTCPVCEKRTARYAEALEAHVHAKCEGELRSRVEGELERLATLAEPDPEEAPKRRSPTRYESLADVIARGGIEPGTKVHATYRGKKLTATILEDGKVRHARKEWGSLSYAAKAACEGAGGRYYLTGWKFWKLDDGRRLEELRRPR
jgi:hypothetical protein